MYHNTTNNTTYYVGFDEEGVVWAKPNATTRPWSRVERPVGMFMGMFTMVAEYVLRELEVRGVVDEDQD